MLEECESLSENPKFCSLSCGTKHQMRNTPRKPPRLVSCHREGCENQFAFDHRQAKKKYCSRSCAAKVNNAKFIKRPRVAQETHCVECGVELIANQRRYCSGDCQHSFTKNNRVRQWLAGEWSGSTQHGLSRVIRNYLIEQAGHRCTSPTCAVPGGFAEINPATGRVPLEVDHIDGDCYNNSPGNLIVLCPNCHALTPTYRALNKVSGRKYRVKYRR